MEEKTDTTLFRARVEPSEVVVEKSEPKSDKQPDAVYEDTNMPPSVYLEAKNHPYLVDLFEMKDVYNQFNMKELSDEINDFILSEIKRQNLKDTKESYQNIVKSYLSKLKMSNDVDIYTRIERITDLMKIDKKLIEAAKEKEDLLTADITDLTSAQLKKRLEINAQND